MDNLQRTAKAGTVTVLQRYLPNKSLKDFRPKTVNPLLIRGAMANRISHQNQGQLIRVILDFANLSQLSDPQSHSISCFTPTYQPQGESPMTGTARQGYTKSTSGHVSQGLNPRVAEPRLRIICRPLTFIVSTCILKTRQLLIGKEIQFGGQSY